MRKTHTIRLTAVLAMVLSLALISTMAAVALTDGQLIRGDVNGDNAVNMKDVLLLRKSLAGMDVAFAEHSCDADDGKPVCGDLNGDGAVNMKDVLLLRKYIAGMAVEFAEHLCVTATGDEPTATGDEPTATGDEPTATGDEPTATGDEPTATGTETEAQPTEPPTTTTTEPPTTTQYIPNELESNPDSIDLVTLTYNNQDASEYGVLFHSFSTLGNPMVQIVEGDVADEAAFAAAREIAATTREVSTKEFDNYNMQTYEFDYQWSHRSEMVSPIVTYVHEATLSGLDFGKTYSYRVGNKLTGAWSPIYTFTTRPATVNEFSFIYTSDTQPHLSDKKAYVGMNMLFNQALSVSPNAAFFVSGGDFVYCSDEGQGAISQWRNVINGGNNFNTGLAGSLYAEHPWQITNGNHDYDLVQNFFNNTTTALDKDYYSFDYGNTHIVILDSGHSGAFDSAQLSWLSDDLSKTKQKFKMVFLHFSFYCATHRDIKNAGRDALPIFDQYNVDFVVSGHNGMTYYTTYPVKNGEVTTTEFTTEDGINYFTSGNGPMYLQNSSSGLAGDLKAGTKGSPYDIAYPQLMQHTAIGGYEPSFIVVEGKSDRLTLNRYYLNNKLEPTKYNVGQVGVIRK